MNTQKTVMLAWELGGGLGHLVQMAPLARDLARRGHRVVLALRDLAGAAAVIGPDPSDYFQAPYRVNNPAAPFRRTVTLPHVLANVGWDDDDTLSVLVAAWRNLFDAVRPELVVFDHSPTALLASRGLPMGRALIGSGYCCPPDLFPMPVFRPQFRTDPQQLQGDEESVLRRANRVLNRLQQVPLQRLGELYSTVDETFLTTFRELDHFPTRPATPRLAYWGPVNGSGGARVEWPTGGGKRIYAYLKKFPLLEQLLSALRAQGNPTVVYLQGVDGDTRRRFTSDALRVVEEPVDLHRISHECDLAVLHGGHGTTSQLLLAGKPVLQLPIDLEQILMAEAVERMGAGTALSIDQLSEVPERMHRLLSVGSYRQAAGEFARRYRDFSPDEQQQSMVQRAESLAAGHMT